MAAVAEWLSSAPQAARRAPAGPQLRLVAIRHVSGVVMVRHDDGMAAIPTRNDRDDVALGPAVLISEPAAHPGIVEVGLPAERHFSNQRLALHSGGGNGPRVVIDQVVAEFLQVPLVIGDELLCDRIATAIGIVLVKKRPLAEPGDCLPVLDLERSCRGAAIGERLRNGSLLKDDRRFIGLDHRPDIGTESFR